MSEHIGVLLPLQLETKFLPPPGPGSPARVLLRVIPQPPSIDTHTEFISTEELRAASTFRRALGRTGRLSTTWFGTPRHREAFAVLARSVGPARAVWLAQHTSARRAGGALVAVPHSGATTDPAADHPPAVRGLPAQLEVGIWRYAGGREIQETIGRLPQGDAGIAPRLPLPDLADPSGIFNHWLTDWAEAVRVGLGGAFDLPPWASPATIGGICVWGLGAEAVGDLLGRHVSSGSLAEVVLGSATKATEGGTTAMSSATPSGGPIDDGSPDEEAFWFTLLRRLAPATSTSLDDALTRYLTGAPVPSLARPIGRERILSDLEIDATLEELFDADTLAAVRAHEEDLPPETALAPLLMRALWPVLWGAFAREEWLMDDKALTALTDWALTHVNPEGHLPSLRFGEEPYAVLPVTRLDTWSGAARDPSLGALRHAVTELRSLLHARLREDGTVRGAGARRYQELLHRSGASARFALRSAIRPNAAGVTLPYLERAETARAHPFHLVGLEHVVHSRDTLPSGAPAPAPFLELNQGADALNLPLVRPPRWTFWGHDPYYRVPLVALLELLLGPLGPDNETTILPTTTPPSTMGALFGSDTWYLVPELDGEGRLVVAPGSLLARLLLTSALTVNRWRAGPGPDPISALPRGLGGEAWALALMRVGCLIDPAQSEHMHWRKPGTWEAIPDQTDEVALPGGTSTTLPVFADTDPDPARSARLARALGAVLDSVSTRIDPWVTAFAWERLRETTRSPGAIRRLGAYGWVNGPFGGTPGPTPSGLLHTPSQAQTLVATLARDNHLTHVSAGLANERGHPPWGLALTGAAIRLAYNIVADLREGHHLYEILGREVERVVTTNLPAGADSPYTVAAGLRTSYPMYPERPDPRQSCNGWTALAGLLQAGTLPGGTPLSEGQRTGLVDLRAGVDALSDLTLLDGALHSSSREPAKAAAAMRGPAGAGPFPEPEFPRTPPSGRELRTTVLSVVPHHPPSPTDTGAALADPSVAALLESELGTDWAWRVRFEDGRTTAVTLADLSLRPVDTVAHSPAVLRHLAAVVAGARGALAEVPEGTQFAVRIDEGENRTWEVHPDGQRVTLASAGLAPERAAALAPARLRQEVLRPLYSPARIPAGAQLQPVPSDSPRVWTARDALGSVLGVVDAQTLGLTGTDRDLPLLELAPRIRAHLALPGAVVSDPPELSRCRQLCRILGAPAVESDFQGEGEETASSATWAELRARYTAAYHDLRETVRALRAAERTSTDRRAREEAIRQGFLWGAGTGGTPGDLAGLAAVLTRTEAPAGATPTRLIARAMAQSLSARRVGSVAPSRIPPSVPRRPPPGPAPATARTPVPDGVSALARALSELTAPGGALPVLTRWSRTALSESAHLTPGDAARIEEEWLTVMAPVRAALGRVEAFQLSSGAGTAGGGLSVWLSGADPWQREAILAARRASQDHLRFGFTIPPYWVAFGPGVAMAASDLAVGVIDSWTEVLPLEQRDTHAAFGFNAPLARAPQTILLAVPPNPGEDLTNDDLAVMLSELRESVVARSASAADTSDLAPLMRTTWLFEEAPEQLFDADAFANPFL